MHNLKVSHIPHIQWINYRVAFNKRALTAIIEGPKPYEDGMGWEKTTENIHGLTWTTRPFLPPSVIKIYWSGMIKIDKIKMMIALEEKVVTTIWISMR